MLPLSLGALAASAILFYFGSGLRPVWALMWLAPVPLLLVARNVSRKTAFLLSFAAYFAGGLNLWHYLRAVLGIPLPVILALLSLPSIAFGLAVLIHRFFVLKGQLWRACLAPAVAWTAYEYGTSLASPHGTFGSLAYTQMDCLPLIQWASFTGVWGISFLLLLFPATVAVLASSASGLQKRSIAVAVAALLVLVFGYGWARLQRPMAVEKHVNVALIASDSQRFPEDDQATIRLIGQYRDAMQRVARQEKGEALVFLLPEKIGVVSEQAAAEVDSMFGEAASSMRATIVAGLDQAEGSRRSNQARIYSPAGAVVAAYRKHHLVPVFEDIDEPGTARTVLKQPSGMWGIQICKDLDFPALSREYARDGVGLLFVPAWDFNIDGWLHGRMAMMRGVEGGFSIARTAKQGRLTVSDYRGVVLGEMGSADASFATMVVSVPGTQMPTFYTRGGDWFAWASFAALAGIFILQKRNRAGS